MSDTLIETTEINSLLIPLHGKQLLIPRSNIMEVASADTLEDTQSGVPWLLGSMEWAGTFVPVVSFEGLCGDDIPSLEGRARVVLFRCLTGVLASRAFGIVSAGFPQLVKVNEQDLGIASSEFGESLPIVCQVSMADQKPVIPDVEKLEQLICDALAVGQH